MPSKKKPAIAGNDKAGKGGYEIGYGKPPSRTRFEKGRSGNPRGRPRGSHDPRALLERVLLRAMPVRTSKGVAQMPVLQAVLLSVLQRAVAGDSKATALGLRQFGKYLRETEADAQALAAAQSERQAAGTLIVPQAPFSISEWERLYGAKARGIRPDGSSVYDGR